MIRSYRICFALLLLIVKAFFLGAYPVNGVGCFFIFHKPIYKKTSSCRQTMFDLSLIILLDAPLNQKTIDLSRLKYILPAYTDH